MFTNRFVTELDRPGIVPDGAIFMYAYATGADADGFAFTYAVGITGPDQPLDGDYARFKSADDAIRFVAAWFAAQNAPACFTLLSNLDTRARELASIAH